MGKSLLASVLIAAASLSCGSDVLARTSESITPPPLPEVPSWGTIHQKWLAKPKRERSTEGDGRVSRISTEIAARNAEADWYENRRVGRWDHFLLWDKIKMGAGINWGAQFPGLFGPFGAPIGNVFRTLQANPTFSIEYEMPLADFMRFGSRRRAYDLKFGTCQTNNGANPEGDCLGISGLEARKASAEQEAGKKEAERMALEASGEEEATLRELYTDLRKTDAVYRLKLPDYIEDSNEEKAEIMALFFEAKKTAIKLFTLIDSRPDLEKWMDLWPQK